MCGIIGYTGSAQAMPQLMHGLKHLEYRGYDSAGIALLHRKQIKIVKAAGKLRELEHALPKSSTASVGIGHTRWATHGAATTRNAHPHSDATGRFSLIHNGIIENTTQLSSQLAQHNIERVSGTDSELIVQWLAVLAVQENLSGAGLMARLLKDLRGTYGLAILDRELADTILVARNGSPVILGVADDATLVASDTRAIAHYTRDVVHLEDGEIATLTPSKFTITSVDDLSRNDSTGKRQVIPPLFDEVEHDYSHDLLSEIMQQPESIARSYSGRLDHRFATARLDGLNMSARDLLDVKRIRLIGCGSALYAGMSGAQMIESLARIPSVAESAAEFRYRNPVIEHDTLYIAISQSGETFDTLAAVHELQRRGGRVLGVVNRVGSSIARAVDGGIYMHAGLEVSVASTKAYSSMLVVFALLSLLLARVRDLSPQAGAGILSAIDELPAQVHDVLQKLDVIDDIAKRHAHARSAFFIGRTAGYPIALEGAQKLKEISYIHAEAYPASELKHGPLALVTPETPSIVVLPDGDLLDKSIGSLQEVKAREAPVIAVSDASDERIFALSDDLITVPKTIPLLQPILHGVALQLLAYCAANRLGRDVDRPRNLAKSVTVE